MDGLFSGQLAEAALASFVIKAFLSGVKWGTPQIGTPSTLSPNTIRVLALVLGVFCGLALKLGPLTLHPGSHMVYAYGNWILGGVLIAFGAVGSHEYVDMAKKPQ